MLPIKPRFCKQIAQKRTAFCGLSPTWQTALKDQALIWGIFGGGALLLWVTGVENTLARWFYEENTQGWAWQLRQYGTWPGMALALAGLGVMLWPGMAKKQALLWKVGTVVALSTILGAGLINQVVVKDLANRARPRETVLTQTVATLPDGFKGHSMPSGHAAMGFVLAAPFFPLRKRQPKHAKAWLGAGLAAGAIIGSARMVAGAHFVSDVLVAGAIGLATASALTALLEAKHMRRPSLPRQAVPWAAGALALLTAAGYMAFNRVELELFTPLSPQFRQFNLPCTPTTRPTPYVTVPMLHVALMGYGAPVSNLKLVEHEGTVSLNTQHGLYHGLNCTAWVEVPQ